MQNARLFVMDAHAHSPLANIVGRGVDVVPGRIGEDSPLQEMPSFEHHGASFRVKAYRVPAPSVGADPYSLVMGMARSEYGQLAGQPLDGGIAVCALGVLQTDDGDHPCVVFAEAAGRTGESARDIDALQSVEPAATNELDAQPTVPHAIEPGAGTPLAAAIPADASIAVIPQAIMAEAVSKMAGVTAGFNAPAAAASAFAVSAGQAAAVLAGQTVSDQPEPNDQASPKQATSVSAGRANASEQDVSTELATAGQGVTEQAVAGQAASSERAVAAGQTAPTSNAVPAGQTIPTSANQAAPVSIGQVASFLAGLATSTPTPQDASTSTTASTDPAPTQPGALDPTDPAPAATAQTAPDQTAPTAAETEEAAPSPSPAERAQQLFDEGYRIEKSSETKEDYLKAASLYEQAAELGHVKARYRLGRLYYWGDGPQKDYALAQELWSEPDMQADPEVQYYLGHSHEFGNGVYMDLDKALYWYEKGAQQGDSDCMCRAGWLLDSKPQFAERRAQCVDWYEKAVAANDSLAMLNLAMLYWNDDILPYDEEKAVELFERSAALGEAGAQSILGMMYMNGYYVERCMPKAIELLKSAAEQGFDEAQYNLAVCYSVGKGIEVDHVKGVELLELAAAQGNPLAQNDLGKELITGEHVPQDVARAIKLLQESAAQGNVEALYNLGVAYSQDAFAGKDMRKAIGYYRQAAEQGDKNAMMNLAVLYRDEIRDAREAEYWFNQAAEMQDERALQYMFKKRLSEEARPAAVMKYAYPLALLGDAQAQAFAGRVLVEITELDSIARGIEFLTEASEAGVATALYDLARCHLDGVGPHPNPSTGVALLKQAADQGDARAAYLLGKASCEGKTKNELPDHVGVEYLEQALNAGETDAAIYAANAYLDGNCGVGVDARKGIDCLTKGANAGDMFCENRLGWILLMTPSDYYSACYGRNPDAADLQNARERGIGYLEDSAYQGFGYAALILAQHYEQNDSEPDAALAWYQEAAWLGDETAANWLVRCNMPPLNDPDNKLRTLGLANAENADDVQTLCLAARMLEKRHDFKQQERAFQLYKRAAQEGYVPAEFGVAGCYEWGVGVERDFANARMWYQNIASQRGVQIEDIGRANFHLGQLYEYGRGVDEDKAKAASYYERALQEGFQPAKSALDRVKRGKRRWF